MQERDKDRGAGIATPLGHTATAVQAAAVQAALVEALASDGFRCRVVPARRIDDLIGEIQGRSGRGEIDPAVRERYMDTYFDKVYPDKFPSPRSLVITAKAVPQVRVTFEWHGRHHVFVIPPTYKEFDPPASVTINRVLGPARYSCARARVPFKLLAARAGLARYGRNNIAYLEDLGSFARLNGWWTDMPAASDPWQEPAMLPACATCQACQKACPTGAISGDQFLIHAGKCLTFFNEDDKPLPAWIQNGWHNALVGCLRCQLCCPANKHVKDWIVDGAAFTEEETAILLDCPKLEAVSPGMKAKLEKLGMEGCLGRNLGLLIDQS